MTKIIKTKIIALILILPSILFAQTAEEAYKELKKVQIRVQVGVSYRDYPSVLAPAKYAVNMYLNTTEATENPELASEIRTALSYYEIANSFWRIKFSKGYVKESIYKHDKELWELVEKTFPDAMKPYENGGVIIKENYVWYKEEAIYIPLLINFIWNKASKKLNEIEVLIYKKTKTP